MTGETLSLLAKEKCVGFLEKLTPSKTKTNARSGKLRTMVMMMWSLLSQWSFESNCIERRFIERCFKTIRLNWHLLGKVFCKCFHSQLHSVEDLWWIYFYHQKAFLGLCNKNVWYFTHEIKSNKISVPCVKTWGQLIDGIGGIWYCKPVAVYN